MCESARRNAVFTLLAGLVLLLFGFWQQPVYGGDDETFYNGTVDAFFWMLRIGGFAFVVVAAVSFAGLRTGLMLDAVASAVCGIVMLLCGLYWTVKTEINLQDVLFIFFGVLFIRAARISWKAFGESGGPAETGVPAEVGAGSGQAATSAEPPHPASVHPESLPREGEAPPPEGYLAALSNEEGKPPDASFK